MVNSVINDLFNGKIEASEAKVPAAYYPHINKIGTEKEYFKAKLDKEDGKQLEHLDEMYHELSSIMCYESYKNGLKIGINLMIEIMFEQE